MNGTDLLESLGEIDKKAVNEARKEKIYGILYYAKYIITGLIFLIVTINVIVLNTNGGTPEPPMDERFSEIDSKYSQLPALYCGSFYKLAVGMSTDDFLHEFGIDVLVEKDPERYPYDKDFCIDIPEREIRVASRDGMIVYVSVYNYYMQGNTWPLRFPNRISFDIGGNGALAGGEPVYIEDVVERLGEPEYLTVDKSNLRKREPQNWAIYRIPVEGENDGYVVFKYRNSGKIVEMGAGIISPEEIAALPQYRETFGVWIDFGRLPVF